MKTIKVIFLTSLFFICTNLYSFDFLNIFRHSEAAPKNSVFVDAGVCLSFSGVDFSPFPLDVRVEYMLPVPLPFSFGLWMKTPFPNLKSFGIRIGYHFNFLDNLTDFFLVYSYDFGWIRKDILEAYGDTSVPIHYYDFRFGVRRFFKSRYGIAIESGFKLQDISLLITIKVF